MTETGTLADPRLPVREVHHQVKNHLNLLSGILTLMKADHPASVEVLGDVQARIAALSALHDRLHRPGAWAGVDAGGYLADLMVLLDRTLTREGSHRLDLEVDPNLVLTADQAAPLGLAAAELLTNSLKHGSHGGTPPDLQIRLGPLGTGEAELRVTQSSAPGAGVCDPLAGRGLGSTLLTAYAGQLGGRWGWDPAPNLSFWVRFPV